MSLVHFPVGVVIVFDVFSVVTPLAVVAFFIKVVVPVTGSTVLEVFIVVPFFCIVVVKSLVALFVPPVVCVVVVVLPFAFVVVPTVGAVPVGEDWVCAKDKFDVKTVIEMMLTKLIFFMIS